MGSHLNLSVTLAEGKSASTPQTKNPTDSVGFFPGMHQSGQVQGRHTPPPHQRHLPKGGLAMNHLPGKILIRPIYQIQCQEHSLIQHGGLLLVTFSEQFSNTLI